MFKQRDVDYAQAVPARVAASAFDLPVESTHQNPPAPGSEAETAYAVADELQTGFAPVGHAPVAKYEFIPDGRSVKRTVFVVPAEPIVHAPSANAVPYPLFVSLNTSAAARRPESCALILASLPLLRAVFREARTTDDRMPMIAITTKSSMRVKPLFVVCFRVFIFIINF